MCEGRCYRVAHYALTRLDLPRTVSLVSANGVRTLAEVLAQSEQVAVAKKERGQDLVLATQMSNSKTELKIQ